MHYILFIIAFSKIPLHASLSATITCLHVTGSCAFNKHENLKLKSYQICKTHRTLDPINFEIWGNSLSLPLILP